MAPIALYPDDLLAQTLVASTYPLEVVQLQQWLAKHPSLKDKALADSVAKQPWDPSIQSMAAVPEVVKRLSDDIQWATELGNAFLAQQGDVMDAVQRMRKKAKANGALESNEQQKVETKMVEKKTVIVVRADQSRSHLRAVVQPDLRLWPAGLSVSAGLLSALHPGAAFVSFSFGVMMGAAMWGGSCCHAAGGRGNNVIINNNNNFNQINHNRGAGTTTTGNTTRRIAEGPHTGDRATANKYGGSARDHRRHRAERNRGRGRGGAECEQSGRSRGGKPSASNRPARSRSRNRPEQVGSRDDREGQRIGERSGFGGGSSGFSGSSARASSSRGSSSMGSREAGSRAVAADGGDERNDS